MNLIFDFDGTICDSIGLAVDTVNILLKEYGIKTTDISEIKKYGLKGIIKLRKIPDDLLEKLVSEYRELSRKNYENTALVKGLPEVLKKLHQKHTLGILTTNEVKNVKKIFDINKINYFKFIRSEKNVFDKDKGLEKILSDFNLKPGETYFIGDETRDIDAAKTAGVLSMSVTWGAESKKLLQQSKPTLIVSKPEELLKI